MTVVDFTKRGGGGDAAAGDDAAGDAARRLVGQWRRVGSPVPADAAQLIASEIRRAVAAVAPTCPKHAGVRMDYADGTKPYHDQRTPHWRCEMWVGGGVCGAIRQIQFRAGGDNTPEVQP
jgi:hypothetical protein